MCATGRVRRARNYCSRAYTGGMVSFVAKARSLYRSSLRCQAPDDLRNAGGCVYMYVGVPQGSTREAAPFLHLHRYTIVCSTDEQVTAAAR